MCGGIYEQDFNDSQETPGTDEQISTEEKQGDMEPSKRRLVSVVNFGDKVRKTYCYPGENKYETEFIYPGTDPQT